MDNINPIMVIAIVLVIIATSGRCSDLCSANTPVCQATGSFYATDGFTDKNYYYYNYFYTYGSFYCPASRNDCAKRCSAVTGATGATYTKNGGTYVDSGNGASTTYTQDGTVTYTNAGGFKTGTGNTAYTNCFGCCTACCSAPAD